MAAKKKASSKAVTVSGTNKQSGDQEPTAAQHREQQIAFFSRRIADLSVNRARLQNTIANVQADLREATAKLNKILQSADGEYMPLFDENADYAENLIGGRTGTSPIPPEMNVASAADDDSEESDDDGYSEDDSSQAWRDFPISTIGLTPTVSRVLKSHAISTLGTLAAWIESNDGNLWRIDGISKNASAVINESMSAFMASHPEYEWNPPAGVE